MNKTDIVNEYNAILEKIMFYSDKSRREGLLALEEYVDDNQVLKMDIMNLGLRLIVDGTDTTYVDRILSNLIEHETDNDKKLLKKITKDGLIEISYGTNPRLLGLLLQSYINIENEDVIKRYMSYYEIRTDYDTNSDLPF